MKLITQILLIAISFNTVAQTVKYKDVVPMIGGTSEEYAISVLKAFLGKNLDHPAANLRLASLYIKKAQETDPLIEYDQTQALAKRAKELLFKASILINEKEVNRNDDYYMWIADRTQLTEANFDLVNQHIKEETEQIEKMQIGLPLVYSDFTSAVDYYDKSIKNFANISSKYPSLKKLYLLYDDRVKEQFSKLKSDYDSSLYYFKNYKTKTDTFKLQGYDQSLVIKPIEVFRYDGLVTQINFLKSEIAVWNYGAWVDTVQSVIDGDIASLRKLLVTNEERQAQALENLGTSASVKNEKVVYVDKSLVFSLLRFDYSSPIVPLLKYKESKQKLIIDESNSIYFDTANIAIERKLIYYTKMVYQIKESDSLIAQFKNRFDAVKMAEFKGFLDTFYNGIDGSSQYMANEKNVLRKELNLYGEMLQEGVRTIKPIDSIGTIVRYRKMKIPLSIEKIDTSLLATGVPYTTQIIEAPDGGYYIAGKIKSDKKIRNTKVFLLKISEQKTPKWFKQYDIKIDSVGAGSDNSIIGITPTSDGVAFVIQSSHLIDTRSVNTLYQVLFDGNLKIEKRLDTTLFPRSLLYNEEQNSVVICFNGVSELIEPEVKNKLRVNVLNSLGEISWTYADTKIGSYVGLIRTKDGFVIIRNSSNNSSFKTLLTKVDNKGLKLDENYMEVGLGKKIESVYKLNDASIHLIGEETYQMINSNFKKIHP